MAGSGATWRCKMESRIPTTVSHHQVGQEDHGDTTVHEDMAETAVSQEYTTCVNQRKSDSMAMAMRSEAHFRHYLFGWPAFPEYRNAGEKKAIHGPESK